LHPAPTLTNAEREGSQNFERRSEMANTCPQVQVPNDVGQVEILTCLRTLAIVPKRCLHEQHGHSDHELTPLTKNVNGVRGACGFSSEVSAAPSDFIVAK